MTTAIVIITGIAVFTSLIIGFVVSYKHDDALAGVRIMIGGTMASIAAAMVFVNYEPAAAPDNTASDVDASVLDSIDATLAEGIAGLVDGLNAVMPLLLLGVFGLIFGAVLRFAKRIGER